MKKVLKFLTVIAFFALGYAFGARWVKRHLAKFVAKREGDWEGPSQPTSTDTDESIVTSPDNQSTQEITKPDLEITVFVTERGVKYHREDCRRLSKGKIAIPLQSAREQYAACAICNPPA